MSRPRVKCKRCPRPVSKRNKSFCEQHRLEFNRDVKRKYYDDPDLYKFRIKRATHQARIKVMIRLGGLHCAACPEADYRVLTIDHVDGLAPHEKRNKSGRVKTSTLLYALLRGDEDLTRFRVLCCNCQIRNEHRRGNRILLPDIIEAVREAGGVYPDEAFPGRPL
jgi:hypothetical protein